jgi:Holliday junction resolvasome RuvABC endonuclease subunit
MIVLSIDPSINFPGYAVFENKRLVEYGVKKTWTGRVKTPDQARLRKLLCDVGDLCYRFNPDVVVIEDYQFRQGDVRGRNKDHIKKMIWSIGVVVVAVPEQFEIVTFKPHEWKGRKSKDDTIFEAKAVYQIKGKLNNNSADAIMLGHHYLMGDGNVTLDVQRRGTAGSGRSDKPGRTRQVRKSPG